MKHTHIERALVSVCFLHFPLLSLETVIFQENLCGAMGLVLSAPPPIPTTKTHLQNLLFFSKLMGNCFTLSFLGFLFSFKLLLCYFSLFICHVSCGNGQYSKYVFSSLISLYSDIIVLDFFHFVSGFDAGALFMSLLNCVLQISITNVQLFLAQFMTLYS